VELNDAMATALTVAVYVARLASELAGAYTDGAEYVPLPQGEHEDDAFVGAKVPLAHN